MRVPALAGSTTLMKRKRHTPEQIVKKLRNASEELGRGKELGEVCRQLGRKGSGDYYCFSIMMAHAPSHGPLTLHRISWRNLPCVGAGELASDQSSPRIMTAGWLSARSDRQPLVQISACTPGYSSHPAIRAIRLAVESKRSVKIRSEIIRSVS